MPTYLLNADAGQMLMPFARLCETDYADLVQPAIAALRAPLEFNVDWSANHWSAGRLAKGAISPHKDGGGFDISYLLRGHDRNKQQMRFRHGERGMPSSERAERGREVPLDCTDPLLAETLALGAIPALLRATDAVTEQRTMRGIKVGVTSRWAPAATDKNGVPLEPPPTDGWAITCLLDAQRDRLTLHLIGRMHGDTGAELTDVIARLCAETDSLAEAHPFRLSAGSAAMVRKLAHGSRRTLDRVRSLVALPAANIWVEWDEDEAGFFGGEAAPALQMFALDADDDGRGELRGSVGALVYSRRHLQIDQDFDRSARRSMMTVRLCVGEGEPGPLPAHIERYIDSRSVDDRETRPMVGDGNPGDLMIAILALLVAPTGLERRHAGRTDDHETWRALRRVREKLDLGGKRQGPVVSRQMTMLLEKDEGKNGEHKGVSGARAYHHVRAFWRVRLGALEFVRDHWRGWEALGEIRKKYEVYRDRAEMAEEED